MKKLKHAAIAITNRGFKFIFVYFKESVWFDWRHGITTSSRVPKDDQTIIGSEKETSEGLLYVASFTSVVTKTLQFIREYMGAELYAKSQFIDLGCGKGKTLIVYSLQCAPQDALQSIGIEYDPVLVDQAKQNVKITGLDNQISIVNDSAVNLLEYAQSKQLIIYLYNSFQGDTLRAVLSTLKSVPHVLIYVDPVEREMLGEFNYGILHDVSGDYNANTYLIARSEAFPSL